MTIKKSTMKLAAVHAAEIKLAAEHAAQTKPTTIVATIVGSGIALAAILTFSSNVFAAKTSDFKLECIANYHVYDQVHYIIPAHHRVPDISGGGMIYEITSLHGKDCGKLKEFYGMNVILNQKLGDVEVPAGAVGIQKGKNIGQDLQQEVSQSFSYVSSYENELPLFPLVHNEYVELLGFSGKADAQKLYGVPAFENLTDAQLALVKDKILSELEYGKIYADSYAIDSKEGFMTVLNSLQFKDESFQKEYLEDLLLVFRNAGKYTTHFVSFIPVVQLGQKINQLIALYGGTKWQSKIDIYKNYPNLFQEQIIAWSFNDDGKAPVLNAEEVEQVLAFVLFEVKKLKPITEVYEAQVLKSQFEQVGEMIKKYSEGNYAGTVHFDLNENSVQLVEEIQQLSKN